MKIKVKEIVLGCMPVISPKGDWIDLKIAEDVTLKKGDSTIVGLGVAMRLPKGMEAIVNPRSSLHKNFGVILSNSQGVIDNVYQGDDDQWGAPLIATRTTIIPRGTRVCQFRIQLSQFATRWQKIKWLFSSPVTLKKVSNLSSQGRGGFGSTGKY